MFCRFVREDANRNSVNIGQAQRSILIAWIFVSLFFFFLSKKTQLWKFLFACLFFDKLFTALFTKNKQTKKLKKTTLLDIKSRSKQENVNIKVCTSYRMIPSTLWQIYFDFFIFFNLFHELSGEWNNSKIWKTKKNLS